jgi:hypothetical protein
LRASIELTFAACWGVADWLITGPKPPSVTHDDVVRLAGTEPLRVCRALVAETDEARAHIVPVHIGSPARSWIELERLGMRPVRFDALDLADRCFAAWNAFLRDHGVALPRWN